MNKADLGKKLWWNYIHGDIKELFVESLLLLSKAETWENNFHDYAFVVFPAAKGYEGFLKQLFLDLGFISEDDYYGKRFRVGKALNPNLETKYREESVYDKLVDFCGGSALADKLWNTWKVCRNLVFHWFPKEKNAISLPEARQRVEMVLDSLDEAFKECKIEM
jgi:hypothetical protein